MRSLFNGDAGPAPAAEAAAPGGWDGMRGSTKLVLGGVAVAGLIAAVVLPGMGQRQAPQLQNQEPRAPARITEYEPPASRDILQEASKAAGLGALTGSAPAPARRRAVPTEMALFAVPVQSGAAAGAGKVAATGELLAGEPGGAGGGIRNGANGGADPDDRLAAHLSGATTLPTTKATLVRNAEFTIRAGDVIPCLPVDAQNSGRPGFTSCRVPEWYRGSDQRRGLLPPGTRWGNGGRAPLLIDPCLRGSTHSMVIGGGGTYKSTTLVTTLLTWRKSAFVLDPAEELADLVGAELADRGRKVVRLGIGGAGPNVLDGIDIADTMAETRLRAIAGRVIGPIPDDDKGGKFKRWGRTIILALLAHMMWDTNIPAELKTLRALRDGLDGGEEAVRNRLRGIAESSPSPLARSLASTMWGMVKETFDGALGNATEDTEWLASEAYADLVSGDAYRMNELVGGNLVVFCQVPQEALEHTPAVARVLVGCHLDAVFAAKGAVDGRVLFPLDEAVLLGRDPSLKIARDQGRKSKITLQLFYQSEGQIEEVWGAGGKKAWFDGLSWRTYAGVQNLDSARELAAMLGTFGAKAVSSGSNRGRSGRPMEMVQSGSRGTNTNEHEISRELAKPDELLADMRDDERITLVRNQRPMRHGAAIGFRRQEIAVVLGQTSYRRQAPPAAAE